MTFHGVKQGRLLLHNYEHTSNGSCYQGKWREKGKEKGMELGEVVLIFLKCHCGVGRIGNVHDYGNLDVRSGVGGNLSDHIRLVTSQGTGSY